MAVSVGKWEAASASGPFPHMEAEVLRLPGGRLQIFGGFAAFTRMNGPRSALLDGDAAEWTRVFGPPLPRDLGRSHAGTAVDAEGTAYVVSGQPGPCCGPATPAAWKLAAADREWAPIAPLPEKRYGCTMQYSRVDHALHLVAGTTGDRVTVSCDHWVYSLADDAWTRGVPIPLGGDHIASVLTADGRGIYVVGGEHGHGAVRHDQKYVPGAYIAHPYLFRYDVEDRVWTRLADLPRAVHHVENQTLLLPHQNERFIVVLGGSTDGDVLVRHVQVYDRVEDRWTLFENGMPAGVKGGVAWFRSGDQRVYLTGGQVARSARDARPGAVVRSTIRAKLTVS